MPGIRDGGVWKEFDDIYIKQSGVWRETVQVWQKNAGSWRLIWEPSKEGFTIGDTEIKLKDGPYIVTGTSDITFRSTADFQADVVMWGSGSKARGGYTYGRVNFKKDVYYKIRTNYGGGAGGSGYGGTSGQRGGGYAGLFEGSTSSVSATLTQALLIAGGSGGASGANNNAGGGGGSSGSNGTAGSGGGRGTGGSQTAGGSGGSRSFLSNYSPSTNGGSGSALSGGSGGNGGASYQNAEPFGSGFIYYTGSDGAGG